MSTATRCVRQTGRRLTVLRLYLRGLAMHISFGLGSTRQARAPDEQIDVRVSWERLAAIRTVCAPRCLVGSGSSADMAMTDPGMLVDPDDRRWASALAQAPRDVYDTPAYVRAEADQIGAEPVGFLVHDDDRVFLLPLLLRSDRAADGVGGPSIRDAISPYGYPGIVMSNAPRTTVGFADACTTGLLEVLRSRALCTAFVRLHPLLNADLASQTPAVPGHRERHDRIDRSPPV